MRNVSCPDRPIFHPARRLKHLMQQVVQDYNRLSITKQKLCHSIDEVKEFAHLLLNDTKYNATIHSASVAVVIKPIRGVASESVALCRTMDDVVTAWNTITSSQVFGATTTSTTQEEAQQQEEPQSQYHTNVLVQEYLYGTEYAVDVVSRNGVHKVTAVWRYEKHSSRNRIDNNIDNDYSRNSTNAPFCYYRTELIDETMLDNEELFETICHTILDRFGRWYI